MFKILVFVFFALSTPMSYANSCQNLQSEGEVYGADLLKNAPKKCSDFFFRLNDVASQYLTQFLEGHQGSDENSCFFLGFRKSIITKSTLINEQCKNELNERSKVGFAAGYNLCFLKSAALQALADSLTTNFSSASSLAVPEYVLEYDQEWLDLLERSRLKEFDLGCVLGEEKGQLPQYRMISLDTPVNKLMADLQRMLRNGEFQSVREIILRDIKPKIPTTIWKSGLIQ